MSVHINPDHLSLINSRTDITSFFGTWTHDIQSLSQQFQSATPYPHLIIDDFLSDDYAELLSAEFTRQTPNWHYYCNPLEVKYAYDDINFLSAPLRDYFYMLSSIPIINIFSQISGNPALTFDPYLHGAGLHAHGNRGRLGIHLDYEKHPISGMERQLNVILFVSKDWNPRWGGANELWNADATMCAKKTEVAFNRAVIFRTNDISWHGVPDIISCPLDQIRQSLAYYYVAPLTTVKTHYRPKAQFIARPGDDCHESLLEIRANRRITKQDMDKYMPNWTP